MVRRYFAGRNPVGQRFGDPQPDTEIIGVVADARVNGVQEAVPPMAYGPILQQAVMPESLEIRAVGDPGAIATSVREAIREVEPGLPVENIRTVSEQVEASLRQERLVARLTSVFAGLALGLACFGLYGVMWNAVTRRTGELGIRMALGATPLGLLAMVLRESLRLVAAGLAVGLVLALAAGRVVLGLLFGIQPSDPFTLAVAVLALLAVAILAAYLPARRASRVDPLVALRYE